MTDSRDYYSVVVWKQVSFKLILRLGEVSIICSVEEVISSVFTVKGTGQLLDLCVNQLHQDLVTAGLVVSELVNEVRDATTGDFFKGFVVHFGWLVGKTVGWAGAVSPLEGWIIRNTKRERSGWF